MSQQRRSLKQDAHVPKRTPEYATPTEKWTSFTVTQDR